MFRTRLSATALIAAGAALGFVAASVDFRFSRSASGASPSDGPEIHAKQSDCCSEGVNKSLLLASAAKTAAPAIAAEGKPNIVVIMGDDVGVWNIGAYHRGMMAGRTPNLDRLAAQGMLFTDYYAEASCTAGRANFITGQLPIRTGMTTVGQAGSPIGLPAQAPTTATVLKSMGYATGQFGKNHLGDLNEFLPTVHGFDEFFGYLYHLDAMEDPAHPNYPPELKDKIGPRNMVHSWATDQDDPTEQPRWARLASSGSRTPAPSIPNVWRPSTTRSSNIRSSSLIRPRATTSRSSSG